VPNNHGSPTAILMLRLRVAPVTINHQAAALQCQALEAEVQLWKVYHEGLDEQLAHLVLQPPDSCSLRCKVPKLGICCRMDFAACTMNPAGACGLLTAVVHGWQAKHSDAAQELERCQASHSMTGGEVESRTERQQHQKQVDGCSSIAAETGSTCASGCAGTTPQASKGQQTQKPPTFSEMQQQVSTLNHRKHCRVAFLPGSSYLPVLFMRVRTAAR